MRLEELLKETERPKNTTSIGKWVRPLHFEIKKVLGVKLFGTDKRLFTRAWVDLISKDLIACSKKHVKPKHSCVKACDQVD